ncbi:uncharacterized protein LOC128547014 [Mercenaria mercenaria]|uniref:uncharacterized protein LOC128547014 n=1 Tax=Mercenaria mercenaria TaxID=6596 RepID=UPI00234F0515|nr:uncharacterized protein LOC128547014 [Mercenaria mercenaria]
MLNFDVLPDELILHVFIYIDLQHLLQSVNRVCHKFNDVIKKHSILWCHFEFPEQLELNKTNLENILSHSVRIVDLFMPCTVLKCKIPEITKVFAASKFTYLDHLNISEAPISTLCWLYNAPNIRVLDLSGCSLLVDEDFQVLVDCFNLEQLYLSFTNITQTTLVKVCLNKHMYLLDACGVKLDVEHCRNLLKNVQGHMISIHISLQNNVDQNDFKYHIIDCFLDTTVKIYVQA